MNKQCCEKCNVDHSKCCDRTFACKDKNCPCHQKDCEHKNLVACNREVCDGVEFFHWFHCGDCGEALKSPLQQPDKGKLPEEWDYLGDMAIQICLMLDRTLPNKYSSSFLETLEIKIKDILEPKIRQLLSRELPPAIGVVIEMVKGMKKTEYYSDRGFHSMEGYNKALDEVINKLKKPI